MDQALVDIITEKVKKELMEMRPSPSKEVKVGVSARHIHLSKEHLEILFGDGYSLNIKKFLMGDQFASEETVTIVGAKLRAIEKVRILGPVRESTQVEISATDAIFLGVKAPVRLSGDTTNSAPISIVGPKGSIMIEEGCIVAKRHIHMHPDDSMRLGIGEGVVSVRIKGDRAGILENVDVRVREDFHFEMHIDTDEANALGIKNGSMVEII